MDKKSTMRALVIIARAVVPKMLEVVLELIDEQQITHELNSLTEGENETNIND